MNFLSIAASIALVAAVSLAVAFRAWGERRHRAELDSLVHAVRHDEMTGLLNRTGFLERLDARLAIDGARTTVLYLDLDRFKAINDTLGHASGDELLRVVGRRIARGVGSDGDAARIGGDEFAVAVTDHSSTHASSIAERLARSIIEPVEISGRLLRVSASVGVAIGPWDDSSPVAVLGFADQALQRAKELGRDRIEVFGSDMRAIDRRRALDEIELRRALDRGEIQPFFRPEFDVEEGRLIGAEIVARWIREDGSILDERELLTVARDANTVERLAVAVVREARPFLRRLELFGLPTNFRFRIDLPHRCTPRAWRDGQIAAAFVGLDMSRVTLDATAEVVAVDPVHAAELLADLRNRGAQVSLRDLSDLEVLGSIAVDEIRLARSVVRGRRPIDDALLGAVADLAHDLGLQLGAGEVTSIDESHRLVDHGCHRQSGPLFGLPITAEDLAELVEKDLVSHLSSTSMP